MKTLNQLTNREQDVLKHLKRGKTNREIADELCVTIKAVEAHVTNIYYKLGVRNRVQAILYLLESNNTNSIYLID